MFIYLAILSNSVGVWFTLHKEDIKTHRYKPQSNSHPEWTWFEPKIGNDHLEQSLWLLNCYYLIRIKALSLDESHVVVPVVKNSLDRHKYTNYMMSWQCCAWLDEVTSLVVGALPCIPASGTFWSCLVSEPRAPEPFYAVFGSYCLSPPPRGTQSPAFICWQKRVLSVSKIT